MKDKTLLDVFDTRAVVDRLQKTAGVQPPAPAAAPIEISDLELQVIEGGKRRVMAKVASVNEKLKAAGKPEIDMEKIADAEMSDLLKSAMELELTEISAGGKATVTVEEAKAAQVELLKLAGAPAAPATLTPEMQTKLAAAMDTLGFAENLGRGLGLRMFLHDLGQLQEQESTKQAMLGELQALAEQDKGFMGKTAGLLAKQALAPQGPLFAEGGLPAAVAEAIGQGPKPSLGGRAEVLGDLIGRKARGAVGAGEEALTAALAKLQGLLAKPGVLPAAAGAGGVAAGAGGLALLQKLFGQAAPSTAEKVLRVAGPAAGGLAGGALLAHLIGGGKSAPAAG